MGPACWDVPTLVKLIDAGMNTARLNFSHGDHEAHGATLKRVREAAAQRPEKNLAILLDTKGPEIRTGFFKPECNGKIHLKAGQTVELTTDYSFKGDETKFACTYDKLPSSVKPGSAVLIADGSLVLTVTECKAKSVMCRVENNQSIGERKNMNLPNVKVDLPVLQPKDIDDLQERPANPIPTAALTHGMVHSGRVCSAGCTSSAHRVRSGRGCASAAGAQCAAGVRAFMSSTGSAKL